MAGPPQLQKGSHAQADRAGSDGGIGGPAPQEAARAAKAGGRPKFCFEIRLFVSFFKVIEFFNFNAIF